jgi:uncharacterized protein YlxP (DUF503 family)
LFVGIARYDFLVPASGSLKDKRQVLRALVSGLQSKYKVAVAEVDYQDLRQRGAVGVCCVSSTSFQAKRVLHEVERYVRSQYAIEVIDVQTEVVNPENA